MLLPLKLQCFNIRALIKHYQFEIELTFRQLRARKALMQFKDVPLRARRALSLYKVHGDSALLVLNGISLNNINALLALSRRFDAFDYFFQFFLYTPFNWKVQFTYTRTVGFHVTIEDNIRKGGVCTACMTHLKGLFLLWRNRGRKSQSF